MCSHLLIVCRSIESLYEELIKEGIVKRYPKVRMADFTGEYG